LFCIGWYHTGSGELKVLTTRTPTSTSYVCALRLALRPWSDHRLADPSAVERPPLRTKVRERWIGPLVALAMLVPLVAVAWLQVPNRASARSVIARAQLRGLVIALEQYRLDVGEYPAQDMGLRSLVEAPPQARGWRGPYVAGNPGLLDTWGRPYIYRMPGAAHDFDIVTLGQDGRPGGTGEDADISNWK
jgi:general secretion pathway protein G